MATPEHYLVEGILWTQQLLLGDTKGVLWLHHFYGRIWWTWDGVCASA